MAAPDPMSATVTQIRPSVPPKTTATPVQPTQAFSANTAAVFGAQIGRVLLAALLEVVYARLLGPAGRGQIGLCLMVNGVGVLVGGLGGEVPIMLWAADKKKYARESMAAILFCGVIGSMFASGLWAACYWLWRPAFLHGITPGLAT